MLVVAACGSDRTGIDPGPEPGVDGGDEPHVVTTYYKDVAPILTRRCAGCHVEDGVAPFALTSYAAAREEAVRIADVTERRIMPPWPAESSGACNTFVDQRWLPAAEIATLGAWLRDGAPEGDPHDAVAVTPPAPPAFTPSVRLQSAQAFTASPNRDQYRCFVVDPALATDRFIRALSVVLDRAEIVHHIQLYSADTAQARTAIANRDASHFGPGYPCDSSGPGTGLRYVGVWAAGDHVPRWPAGTGMRIPAGAHMVLQFHYHNHGTVPITDRSAVDLELSDLVTSEAEIHDVSGIPLHLPPGQAETIVSAASDVPISSPTMVRAVRLHMHELGTHARLELERGGARTCLLDIPRWNVGWQLFYSLDQPIALQPGDKLRVTCSYDTTSKTEPVTWGLTSDDEMCLGYTYVAN